MHPILVCPVCGEAFEGEARCPAHELELVNLALRVVRPAGKKAMTTSELLRGYGIAEGDAFRAAGTS